MSQQIIIFTDAGLGRTWLIRSEFSQGISGTDFTKEYGQTSAHLMVMSMFPSSVTGVSRLVGSSRLVSSLL